MPARGKQEVSFEQSLACAEFCQNLYVLQYGDILSVVLGRCRERKLAAG